MAEVNGLLMDRIVASIKWRGSIFLMHTGEKEESLLGEVVWPKKTGKTYYACATTGLLFDKVTGECVQTQRVGLLLDTLGAASPKDMKKYLADRKSYCEYGYNGKRRYRNSPDFEGDEE